jgi:L-threonylcarbamoyladenylate synthase
VKTQRLIVDPTRLDTAEAQNAIASAARILRSGGLVALPTETVYGLGANALDSGAVERIFAAKQRPAWDPVIVHIAGPIEANPMFESLVTEVPVAAHKLIAAFWPGPLTLLLPRSSAVPDAVTAGRPLVGIRMPAHPVAFEVIRQAGVPVAAPSANTFSHTSPTTAAHVLDDLDARIDAILDAGPTAHGLESTVVDPCQNPMIIYRPGAVTIDAIRAVAGPVEFFKEQARRPAESIEALPSPGVGLRHYAPRARLILVDSELGGLRDRISTLIALHPKERIGLMLPDGTQLEAPPGGMVFQLGDWANPEQMAHLLYSGLRTLDAARCTLIVCPVPTDEGIGVAIRDRLRKASRQG